MESGCCPPESSRMLDAAGTLDDLKSFSLRIFQPQRGYRYSLDPLLLARFSPPVAGEGRIADLGAGCGIIGLVLARVNPLAHVTAIENNQEMALIAGRNAEHNGLSDRVTVLADDVLNLRSHFADSLFDLVVCNPPFRAPHSGRISPRAGRDSARHETTACLADFLGSAKYLVKPSGRICFIQLPSRLHEFMSIAAEMKLSVLRLRMVHNNAASPAAMFMAELAKGRRASPVVEAPLFVRDMNGDYTDEVWR